MQQLRAQCPPPRRCPQAPGTAAELAALAAKGVRLGPLLGLLLPAAAGQALADPHCEQLLEEIVGAVPLGELSHTGGWLGAKAQALRPLPGPPPCFLCRERACCTLRWAWRARIRHCTASALPLRAGGQLRP